MGTNYISGKFGNVQRILPSSYNDGIAVWDEMGGDGYVWSLLPASNNWYEKARPTANGLAKLLTQDPAYSNTVSALKSWKMENNVNTQQYAASNTRGYNAKYAGTRNATGTFDGIGGFPPLNPGDRFLFRGFVGPESGSNIVPLDGKEYADISGYVYQIAAVVTSVGININYGTFAPIEWSIGWQSDWQQNGEELLVLGIPHIATESDPLSLNNLKKCWGFYDYTNPPCGEAVPSTKCMLAVCDDDGLVKNGNTVTSVTNVLQVCLESANLTFNTQTNPVTNSCSAAAGGWQMAIVGTTEAQIAATIHGSNYAVFHSEEERRLKEPVTGVGNTGNIKERSRLHYPGIDRFVRIYIGNSDNCAENGYWEFYKMFIGSYTGLNVDAQSGAIVSFSTNFDFNAFPRKDGMAQRGFINYKFPGASETPVPFVDLSM